MWTCKQQRHQSKQMGSDWPNKCYEAAVERVKTVERRLKRVREKLYLSFPAFFFGWPALGPQCCDVPLTLPLPVAGRATQGRANSRRAACRVRAGRCRPRLHTCCCRCNSATTRVDTSACNVTSLTRRRPVRCLITPGKVRIEGWWARELCHAIAISRT